MSPHLETLLITLLVTIFFMVALWIVSITRRDASIADPFWGFGFTVVAWVTWLINWPPGLRVQIIVGLITIWGLRLSLHLLRRNLSHGEDRRYAAMRDHHGPCFWWVSLFTVFLLQGLLLWFVSLPLQFAATLNSSTPLGWIDFVGIAIWTIGFFFEAVGDWQLARFKSNPSNEGRVMDRGLWRYTRHPNYFGDFCIWWGIYLMALSGGAWFTILSPLLMTTLLLKVSGVSLVESTITDRRPDYKAYAARTNAFFPGPRKRKLSI